MQCKCKNKRKISKRFQHCRGANSFSGSSLSLQFLSLSKNKATTEKTFQENCHFQLNRTCWTLDASQTASYEITLVRLSIFLSVRLSVLPSITKLSQDWIISFF